jgi:hypothetical protein
LLLLLLLVLSRVAAAERVCEAEPGLAGTLLQDCQPTSCAVLLLLLLLQSRAAAS